MKRGCDEDCYPREMERTNRICLFRRHLSFIFTPYLTKFGWCLGSLKIFDSVFRVVGGKKTAVFKILNLKPKLGLEKQAYYRYKSLSEVFIL